ncbi:DinB family protein [Nocardioides marinquilinus]|uniref:DinB family protein n=1 Tax=Nocardioides marinquilinus TaxID=1210400 RepID=UPI0031EEB496
MTTPPAPDHQPDRELLLSRLTGRRRHVLDQLEGLDDGQLRRPVLPSGWSCLGLLRHLTLSDERYWFEVVVAGGPLDFFPDGENADWSVAPDEPAEQVLAAYRAAVERSDAIIAARRLDTPPAVTEPWWAEAGLAFPDLRSVVMHVLVETATHAGHLDAVRELIDGRQHIVL